MTRRITILLYICFAVFSHTKTSAQETSWVPFGPVNFYDSHSFGNGRVVIATDGCLLWSQDEGESFSPQYFDRNSIFRSIEFIDDDRGYVAGSGGSIFKTIDGGDSWMPINSPTNSLIMDLELYSSNTILVLDIWGKLHVSSSSGQSWTTVGANDSLTAPLAWSRSKLLITGSSGTLYTVDGATFALDSFKTPLTSRINAMDAMSDTILACFGQEITRSIDGGKTWNTTTQSFAGNVQVVKIIDDRVLIFVDGPSRYLSANLGDSWSPSPLSSDPEKFAFAVRRFGWTGKDGWNRFIGWFGTVYGVSPDGTDQRVIHQCFPSLPFQRVHLSQVPNDPREWRGAAEFYSSLFITSDNGWSWYVRKEPNVLRESMGVSFINASTGIAIPTNTGLYKKQFFRTSDNGLTWEQHQGMPRDSGKFMYALVRHEGMLELFGSVRIFRSYDAGFSWPDTLYYEDPVPKEAQFRGGISDASFFGRDTIYLRLSHPVSSGFARNTFVRSTDRGNSWSPYLVLETHSFYSMAFATPSIGYIVGNAAVIETRDGGLSWQRRQLSTEDEKLRSIVFNSTGSVGVICGLNGVVYHTLDSGITWTRDTTWIGGYPGAYNFSHAQFINDSTGVIQSDAAFFRRTFDLPKPQASVEAKKFDIYFYAFLYPNPATEDHLKVYLHGLHAVSNKASLTYEIHDMWGRAVRNQTSFGVRAGEVAYTKEINLEGLTSGIYYLRVSCTDGMRVLPFSVVK